MELFLLEHKKLWRKNSVKISVILCFTYAVIFGSVLSYQCFNFGSRRDYTTAFGKNFDGYTMIRECQEYAHSFGGELTDETMQQLVWDYQRMESADMKRAWDLTDWVIIDNWLEVLWPELKESGSYQVNIDYFEPEKLTGIYERRQLAVEKLLEMNSQIGKEGEYLLKINEKVNTPFQYKWVYGWSIILPATVGELGIVVALFLAIALSPMFAGEWHNNTSSLVLTTKNGWKNIAFAKVLTGLAFSVEFFTILAVGNIVSQLFFMGTEGWDMPIQMIKMTAIAPMNMLQGEIYEYVFTLLGAVGFAGIIMLISAAVKNNVLALILSLAVVYVPTMIDQYLPYGLQKAMDLIPLVGSGTDIFRTNTFNICGKIIWSPYLLITVPVLIGIACIPFTVKRWSRRLKI